MKDSYALIGDLHSQADPFREALSYCKDRNLTPILLGDLFDSRTENTQSAEVYYLAKQAQEEQGAIILRSNHQNKLERLAKGNKVRIGPELQSTLNDFEEADLPLEEVAEWLNTFPYGVVFKDAYGQEYRCAHAMFPSWLVIPQYLGVYKVFSVTRKAKDYMIYGPQKPGKQWPEEETRVFWWEEEPKQDWIRVAGHYHVIHISDKSLVLDGNMGGSSRPQAEQTEVSLCLWDVNSRELVKFL